MASDINLNPDSVVVEGNYALVRAWDLMLDTPTRRIFASGLRRALVHDFTDRLTLNYARDYPNGVRINGRTSIEELYLTENAFFAKELHASSLIVGGRVPDQPVVTASEMPSGSGSFGAYPERFDVGETLHNLVAENALLKDDLAALRARVAALEGGG